MKEFCGSCGEEVKPYDAIYIKIDEDQKEVLHELCARQYWCEVHEDYCAGNCDADIVIID